jgi:hypothetical protein
MIPLIAAVAVVLLPAFFMDQGGMARDMLIVFAIFLGIVWAFLSCGS